MYTPKIKVSLWSVAIVGFVGVLLLYRYVSASFLETTAYDDETVTGLYLDNPPGPPVVVSSGEEKRILAWIKKSNLNQYGEAKTTKYGPGEPLQQDGKTLYVNRFHYIISKHVMRPWNDGTPYAEKTLIDTWITTNNLNQFGDSPETSYSGGTPLVNGTSNTTTDRYDYIEAQHPDRPWATFTSTVPRVVK